MPSRVLHRLLPWVPLLGCGLVGGASTGVLHPQFDAGGLLARAEPLSAAGLEALGGFYASASGADLLGQEVVAHASPGYLSVFGARDGTYAVLRAGCLDDGTVVLEGYHRTPVNTDTGLVRLLVEPEAAAQALCTGGLPTPPWQLAGSYGSDEDAPDRSLVLDYGRPLPSAPGAMVVAHRGGCRTSDDCGASENSVEVLRLAQRLGADRVEVDVRVTSDGVPILYHDDSFGPLLTRGPYCRGPVEDFTWGHVQQLCELKYGEPVPSLDEALRVVVEETQLVGIWLDVKTVASVGPAIRTSARWRAVAAEQDRDVHIVIGLGTEDLLDEYLDQSRPAGTECLVELDPADVRRAGCHVWAPRWTRGPMADSVTSLQAEGHIVAFWTLDDADFIDLFLEEAHPDALLTNRPGLALHRAYQWPPRGEP